MIKPGTAVWMSHPSRITVLEPWPSDTCQTGDVVRAGVALVFADDCAVLRSGLTRAAGSRRPAGEGPGGDSHLWILHKGRPGPGAVEPFTPVLDEFGLAPGEHVALNGRWAALRVS